MDVAGCVVRAVAINNHKIVGSILALENVDDLDDRFSTLLSIGSARATDCSRIHIQYI